jgi:hypothetical protein
MAAALTGGGTCSRRSRADRKSAAEPARPTRCTEPSPISPACRFASRLGRDLAEELVALVLFDRRGQCEQQIHLFGGEAEQHGRAPPGGRFARMNAMRAATSRVDEDMPRVSGLAIRLMVSREAAARRVKGAAERLSRGGDMPQGILRARLRAADRGRVSRGRRGSRTLAAGISGPPLLRVGASCYRRGHAFAPRAAKTL